MSTFSKKEATREEEDEEKRGRGKEVSADIQQNDRQDINLLTEADSLSQINVNDTFCKCRNVKEYYVVFGEEVQTQNFNVYNNIEVIIQTVFYNGINKLFSD